MNLFKRTNKKVDYYESEPPKPSPTAKISTITWLWLFILMLAGATAIFFILWYRYQQPTHPVSAKKNIPTNTVTTVSATLPLTNTTTTTASLLQNITWTKTNSEMIIDFHFNGKVTYDIQRQATTNQLIVTFNKVRLTHPININKLNSSLATSIKSSSKNNTAQVIIKIKPNTEIEHVTYLKNHKTLQMILYRK